MKTLVDKKDGFDIYFEPLEEYSPDFSFWDEDLKNETFEKLENYELVLFCAHVTAEKNNNIYGEDYLGMCVYESYEDFYIKYKDDYFADMVRQSLSEAKEEFKKLIEDYKNKPSYIPVNIGGII